MEADADGDDEDEGVDGLDDGLEVWLDPEPPEPLPPEGDDGLLGSEPLPDPLPDPPDPLPDPPDPVPPELGEAVGEVVCDGDEVAVGVGVGVGVAVVFVTGGATLGGTLVEVVRSCCHDHPTEPPAGTVSEPTP